MYSRLSNLLSVSQQIYSRSQPQVRQPAVHRFSDFHGFWASPRDMENSSANKLFVVPEAGFSWAKRKTRLKAVLPTFHGFWASPRDMKNSSTKSGLLLPLTPRIDFPDQCTKLVVNNPKAVPTRVTDQERSKLHG
jgi:hypothetical protein